MGTTSYRKSRNPDGHGWDVLYDNPVTGVTHPIYDRLTEDRADRLVRGSNLMMDQVLGAAARAYQDSVRTFHRRFGQPNPDELEIPKPEMLRFRARLIREEAKEAGEVLEKLADEMDGSCHDKLLIEKLVAKCLNEMADSLYVGFGGFVLFGVAAWPIFQEVQRANMDKIPDPKGGKPLKPEGWVPPRIKEMITGSPGS